MHDLSGLDNSCLLFHFLNLLKAIVENCRKEEKKGTVADAPGYTLIHDGLCYSIPFLFINLKSIDQRKKKD